MIEYLLKEKELKKIMVRQAFEAVKKNDLNKLQNLINRGVDVNFISNIGNTLLDEAINRQNLVMIDYLCCQPNIDVNKKSALWMDENFTFKIVDYVTPLEKVLFVCANKEKLNNKEFRKFFDNAINILMKNNATADLTTFSSSIYSPAKSAYKSIVADSQIEK